MIPDIPLILSNHPEPMPGYKFTAIVNNVPMGFSKITNIESSIALETFQEGGVNHKVHLMAAPDTAEKTLVMERGVANRGLAFTLMTEMIPGQRLMGDIILLSFDRNGMISKVYFATDPILKKWSCSDFDASSGELVIEKFEVAYETFERNTAANAGLGAVGEFI